MKTIKNIVLAPFKIIKWLIVFAIEVASTLILAFGTLLWGIGFMIKDFKTAKMAITEMTKKILQ